MKRLLFLLLMTCMGTWCAVMAQVKYSINEHWLFWHGNEKPDAVPAEDWRFVDLPHTWNDRDAVDDVPGYYRGAGWYRKNLRLDETAKGKQIYLFFEGADQKTELYVNGQAVATHKGGYTMFCADITPYVTPGQENLLLVKVDNSHDENIPPLSADFTFFGGIYRDVYVVMKEPVNISLTDKASSGVYVRTPVVNDKEAEVEVEVLLNNATPQKSSVICEQTVYAPSGKIVKTWQEKIRLEAGAKNFKSVSRLKIQQPQLWSPASPALYTVKTQLKERATGKVLDEVVENFGLRWFSFDADKGFFLNGKPLKLIGTSRHQCYQGKGNALDDAIHISDVRLLKEMGGNFLRVSHYPQDPLILDMCDKLGILTSVEIPIVNAVTESEKFLANSLNMVEEMVKQSYNHPSVVIWAYMNEVMLKPPYDKKDGRYQSYCQEVNRQARELEQTIRGLDAQRYTLIPFHGSVSAYEDAGLFTVPMIVGWNLYQGWYGGNFDGFDKFMLAYKEKYPRTPVIITEYGADVDVRIHSDKPERFDYSVEYGDLYHEHYLNSILSMPFIAGANIWNLNDFHSESRGNAVPHINCKGITTQDRQPKNTYYLYKARLDSVPFVKFADSDWQLRSGLLNREGMYRQTVKIYSNQPRLTVLHNGKSLGIVNMVNGVGTIDITPAEGKNILLARADAAELAGYLDLLEFTFKGVKWQPGTDFTELNVTLGSACSFTDVEAGICWAPEKEYEQGSWGYVGGQPFRPKTRHGTLPASDLDIWGTDKDPLFQTRRDGIEAFKADVPDGRYAIYLYLADLVAAGEKEVLPYNLGNDAVSTEMGTTVVEVSVNGQQVLPAYDIRKEAGSQRAVIKKIQTDITEGQGLNIEFKALTGKAFLNAIRIVKLD